MTAPTVLSTFTDEELLRLAYSTKERRTQLEIELAARLEHALDELEKRPPQISMALHGQS